jgi:hypothetical protein
MARSGDAGSGVVRLCAGLLAVGLLGGCGPGGRAPEAPSATTAAPLSMEDYAGRLGTGLDRIKSEVATVAAARSYQDLLGRLTAARLSIDATVEGFRGLAVPTGTKAAHDRLLGQLGDLSLQLGYTEDAVRSQDLCAAPSVVAELNRSGVPGKLDAAGQELAAVTGGLYKPVQLVPVGRTGNRGMANGTMVRRPSGSGRNVITVDNRRSGVDVVVTMAKGKRPLLSVYVRRKSKARVGGVPGGTYTAYFTSGNDWDRSLRVFTRDCTFERFKGSPKFGLPPRYYALWEFWMSDGPADADSGKVEPPTAGLRP